MLTPNELVLPFGGSYVCANFGENRSRNATVRVLADGQTHTHRRKPIAMGQITSSTETVKHCQEYFGFDLPSVMRAKRMQKFEVKFGLYLSSE